jgi:hypothetical protein
MGDHISLQRKNYPVSQLTFPEEYALYSNIALEDTAYFMRGIEEDLISSRDITAPEAIKLVQNGYTPIPFKGIL